MKIYTIFFCILFAVTQGSNGQVPVWAIQGNYSAIAADAAGCLYASAENTVTKIDSSGQVIWNKSFGAPVSYLQTAADGSVYITGLFSATIQLGEITLVPVGAKNIFVARLDPQGNVEWARQISTYASATRIENFQLATDSKSNVYVSAVVYQNLSVNLFFQKYSSTGSARHTRIFRMLTPPVDLPTLNTISVDRQDNLHVVYYTGCHIDPNKPRTAQSRSWFDSAGTELGFDCDIKETEREGFTGYRAGNSPSDYVYTKLRQTLMGSGYTFLTHCEGNAGSCYRAPAVNPDLDRFGNAYYAGYTMPWYGSGCNSFPSYPTVHFFCTKNTIINRNTDPDIYVVFGDTLISTKDHGNSSEEAYSLAADPNGRSVYILGSWYPWESNGSFQFGNATLVQPGRMILRYRLQRKPLIVDAGTDKSICTGDTVTIGPPVSVSGGTAPYTYEWLPAKGLSNNKIADPVAQPETTTDYVLTVTDAKGAFGIDTVRVWVADAVTVQIPDSKAFKTGVLPNTVYTGYAPASKITLGAVTAGGTAPLRYSWSQGSITPSITVQPQQPTEYSVTVTDAKGCTASASKKIEVQNVSCGNNGQKVQVSHTRAGKEVQPLCIAGDAVEAHLMHGDYLGNGAGESNSKKTMPGGLFLNASPNPSAGQFTIRFSVINNGPVQLRILDADGRVMEALKIISPAGTIVLGTRYPAGVYFAEMVQGTGRIMIKLIKTSN